MLQRWFRRQRKKSCIVLLLALALILLIYSRETELPLNFSSIFGWTDDMNRNPVVRIIARSRSKVPSVTWSFPMANRSAEIAAGRDEFMQQLQEDKRFFEEEQLLSKMAARSTSKVNTLDSKMKRSLEYCNSLNDSTHDDDDDDSQGPDPLKYRLIASVVLIRHGDRTPFFVLPNHKPPVLSCSLEKNAKRLGRSNVDRLASLANLLLKNLERNSTKKGRSVLLRNFSPFPNSSTCSAGELTADGYVQMVDIGRRLREAYADRDLFADVRNVSQRRIYVRTTESSRTFQSATAFLQGFLSDDVGRVRLTLVSSQDVYFCSTQCRCPASERLVSSLRKVLRSTLKDDALEQSVRRKVADVFDVSPGQLPWTGAVVEVLMSHACHRLQLPCHRNDSSGRRRCVTWDAVSDLWRVHDAANRRYADLEPSRRLARLNSYPLLCDIVHILLTVIHHDTRHKSSRFSLFSGHDKTVAAVVAALGVDDHRWPPFGSRLVFELYDRRDERSFYVRILYNGRDVTKRLKFCDDGGSVVDGLCSFDDFMYFVLYDIYEYFGDVTYTKICQSYKM